MFWLLIARLYAYWVWIMAKRFGLWLPGLGFLCRRITLEHIITYNDRKYVFLRRAASMYSTLLIGKPMEPETHAFLRRVIPQGPSPVGVVDVGAAIGEMVIEAAGFPNVATVVAFDPDPDNVEACRASAAVNGFGTVVVIPKAVADRSGSIPFVLNRGRGSSGHIAGAAAAGTEAVACTTLDDEIVDRTLPYVMIIDVEGAELLVLRGAQALIRDTRPLIVFEYITGRDTHMADVRTLLGEGYEVYRLRSDGYLDGRFEKTWNCVAVPRGTTFHRVCSGLVRDA